MTGKNFKEKYLKQIKLKNKFEGKNFYILKKVVINFFKKIHKHRKKKKKRISTRPARSSAGLPRRPAPALGASAGLAAPPGAVTPGLPCLSLRSHGAEKKEEGEHRHGVCGIWMEKKEKNEKVEWRREVER